MLRPPIPTRRERILAMGSFGTGKTSSWLSVAQWSVLTGSDSRFYVIDTDASVNHMTENHPARDRIQVWNAFEWEQYEAAIEQILPMLRHNDWLVVDFIGQAWEAVQDWYVSRVYKTSIEDFFMTAREQIGKGSPLDGNKDWSIINKVYKSWLNKVMFTNDAQIFVTAQAEGLRDTDDRTMKATFQKVGARPRGQKNLGHQVHTVLHYTAIRPGDLYLTTVKDRERQGLEGAKLNDFTVDYLVGVAGWEM
jgi:hypothetical protein